MVADPGASSSGSSTSSTRGDELWAMPDDGADRARRREAESSGCSRRDEVRRHRGPHAAGVPGVRRRLRRAPARCCALARRLREPVHGRPQRPAPLQQPGPLDADGHLAARNVARRVARRLVGQRGAGFHEEVRERERTAARATVLTPRLPVAASARRTHPARRVPTLRRGRLGGRIGITAMVAARAQHRCSCCSRTTDGFVPMLSLLGNYLFGYRCPGRDCWSAMAEVGVCGFGVGWTVAQPDQPAHDHRRCATSSGGSRP